MFTMLTNFFTSVQHVTMVIFANYYLTQSTAEADGNGISFTGIWS